MVTKPQIPRLFTPRAVILCCDMQGKLLEMTHGRAYTLAAARALCETSAALDVPMCVSEQYPKGLGHTSPDVLKHVPKSAPIFEKTSFSMIDTGKELDGPPESQTHAWLHTMPERNQVIIFGIEAHVCIQQTVLDLLENDYQVWVAADGVSSQRAIDREMALVYMKQCGAVISTSEASFLILSNEKSTQHSRL
eukprot:GEMP01041977.1.p1 GENE.GEMP01041977.1~~GEMP01041977.1.p1  ORF type:complete len:214 (+),score=35.61 GEMP01041977.1:66-644(+)